MVFQETSIFTKQVCNAFDDECYRALQQSLLENPSLGNVIKGTKGIRKIRWQRVGQGKREGYRIIYFVHWEDKVIFMLLMYPKNEQEDLTTEQLKKLNQFITHFLE